MLECISKRNMMSFNPILVVIFHRCIIDDKVNSVIQFCYFKASRSYFSSKKIAAKILQCRLYWPTLFKDSHMFCKTCENCQMLECISKRNMMSFNPILVFYCWGINLWTLSIIIWFCIYLGCY